MARGARVPVEWGIASRCRPRRGHQRGRARSSASMPDGHAAWRGIDGLGHGGEAARAAQAAAEVVRASPSRDLVTLVQDCHAALRGTRGAAISLAFVSAANGRVTWLGVGNVEGRVAERRRRPGARRALARALAAASPATTCPASSRRRSR